MALPTTRHQSQHLGGPLKLLTALFLSVTTALLGLSACTTAPSGGYPLPSATIKEQCFQNAMKSNAHCEFMNQENPQGLAECNKTKILADNRCKRLGH